MVVPDIVHLPRGNHLHAIDLAALELREEGRLIGNDLEDHLLEIRLTLLVIALVSREREGLSLDP